jgi:hypothetical protein
VAAQRGKKAKRSRPSGKQATARAPRRRPAAASPSPGGKQPDVLLDVPTLKVDEISLDVEELHAKVALHARLASMVSLDVGTSVDIGKVSLNIKGVEAQAFLKVHLENVYAIMARALDSLDENPELLLDLPEQVDEAEEAGGEADRYLLDSGQVVEVPSSAPSQPVVEGQDSARFQGSTSRRVAAPAGRSARKKRR